MRKRIIVLSIIIFAFTSQVQAVSTNANQGNKAGKTTPQTSGNQGSGNAVQTKEQNRVKNQGETNQIQTEEQNSVETQGAGKNKPKDNRGQLTAASHRSVVANAVQELLAVAEREGGIGQQVRVIAQQQNQIKDQAAEEISAVENRSKLKTFFFGSDFKNLGDLRSQMVQTRNQISQLTRLMNNTENDQDKIALQTQIQTLEQEQVKINDFIIQNENKFSLFGWAVKLFQ